MILPVFFHVQLDCDVHCVLTVCTAVNITDVHFTAGCDTAVHITTVLCKAVHCTVDFVQQCTVQLDCDFHCVPTLCTAVRIPAVHCTTDCVQLFTVQLYCSQYSLLCTAV